MFAVGGERVRACVRAIEGKRDVCERGSSKAGRGEQKQLDKCAYVRDC